LKALNEKKSDEASELAHDLIKKLFGPNSFTHFSAKKNYDIMIQICGQLNSDQITDYIDTQLSEMLTSPEVKAFYLDSIDHPEEESYK